MVSIAATLGVGSGIDTAKLVSDLAAASRQPKVAALDQRTSDNKARISALAQVRSDIESFATSFATLVSGGTLQTQPSSSDTSILSAIALPGTRLGDLASEVEITQLAKAQTLYASYLPDAAAPVGQGAMTLSLGGTDYAITIDAGNDSLAGLANAINATASGVTATIASDASGARLVLKGPTGAAGAFSVTRASGDVSLDRFSFPSSGGGMTQAQAAQDAHFAIDGIAYTRGSNTVSDVFPGVTLSLKQAAPGKPVSLTSNRPNDTIKQTLQDFVSAYNTLKTDLAKARTTASGDQGLRSLEAQLSSLVGKAVSSHADINSLSDIGVATNRDGSLKLDLTKLDAALKSNPDAVEALFSPTRDATHDALTDPGLSGILSRLKDAATGSGGALTSIKNRLEKEGGLIDSARERMETREAAYKERLTKQFGGMDSRVATLKATQSYLDQQIKLWTNRG